MLECEVDTLGRPVRSLDRPGWEPALDDVYRYARFRLGSTEDAEDVAMETWHVLQTSDAAPTEADSRRFYAIGIARRKVADALRRRKWQIWRPAKPADWIVDQSDDRLMVGRVLAKLTDEHREVLALKYFHEFTSEEIAELIDRTPVAVNSLLQRARDAFARASQDSFTEKRR